MNDNQRSVAIDPRRPKPLTALIVSASTLGLMLGVWAGLVSPSTAAVVLGCTAALLAGCLDQKRMRLADLVRVNQVAAHEQARFSLLAENTADILMLKSPSGARIYVSPSCRAMLGYEPDEFLSISSSSFLHPDDYDRVTALNRGISEAQPHFSSLHRLRHKAGHYVWVEALFELTKTSEGEPIVVGSIRDVSERHRQAEELKAAKEAAEKANEAKSAFLATMSHEVRTPLNGILGYADLLLQDAALTDPQRRNLVHIQSAGAALLTVLNDVLDFSKVEAGQIELHEESFTLADLMDGAAAIVRGAAEKKGLAVNVELGDDVPAQIVGDAGRLRQILLNLLNNAVKFTDRGGVTAAASLGTAERLRIAVTDTGDGISPEKIGRLFKRFSQADSSVSRQYGGTGLGLAICKSLVELMGGQIGMDSVEGAGSTFWFEIPLRIAQQATLGADTQAKPIIATRSLRILVADDVAMNRDLVRAVLESAGHRVDAIDDGAAAVRDVQERPYDVILMDVQMPGVDGIAATLQIRALEQPVGRIPIIGLTANVLKDEVDCLLGAGMNHVVAKPFRREELYAALERFSGPEIATREEVEPAGLPSSGFDQEGYDTLLDLLGREKVVSLLRELGAELEQRFQGGGAIEDERSVLARDAHVLAGSAGMLGFTRLSAVCKEVETAYKSAEDFTGLMEQVRDVRRTASAQISALIAA